MRPEELQKIFSERIPQLCLMDDELFCAVFDGDIECAQYILRIILDDEKLTVKSAVVQKTESNLKGRGVRFDVLAESDGVIYDIEVQRTSAGAAPRRARYNSSMLDINILNRGSEFNDLLETYVIFITERDVFKKGLPIYHIRREIDETGDIFDDGAHIIYVNGENRDETPLGLLMRDFCSRNPDQMNESVLKKRTKRVKGMDKGGVTVSAVMQDIYDLARVEGREAGLAEGRKAGIEEGRAEMIINMIKLNQPVEFIAKVANMPVEKVIAIAKARGLVQ